MMDTRRPGNMPDNSSDRITSQPDGLQGLAQHATPQQTAPTHGTHTNGTQTHGARANTTPLHIAPSIRRLADMKSGDTISINDLLQHTGTEGLSFVVLVLSLVSLGVSALPGTSLFFGLALLWISVQMLRGRDHAALPQKIGKASFKRESLQHGLHGMADMLEHVEKMVRPRFENMLQSPFSHITNVMLVALSVLLLLPIPFANWPCEISIALLALGRMQRDELVIAIGQLAGLMTICGLLILLILTGNLL